MREAKFAIQNYIIDNLKYDSHAALGMLKDAIKFGNEQIAEVARGMI